MKEGTINVDPLPTRSKSVPPSLKERVLHAGSWSALVHFLSIVLRLGSSLVMTRLLAPEMFGVMAIAMVVQVIIFLLTDVGLRQSIIQSHRGDEPAFLNTAWTMQAIRGGIVFLGCICVAFAIGVAGALGFFPAGSVYSVAILPYVIAAASISAAIAGFQSTKAITANRNLDLKRVVLIELFAQLIGIVVMFGLGWLTRSIWSFVVGGLVSSATSMVLSHTWLVGENNRFVWDTDAAKEIIGYGRWIFLSSILGVLSANADRLLIGVWVSATVLGYYAIALNLATVVEGLGSRLFGSVSMPALSEVARSNAGQFRRLYFRMRLPLDLAFVGIAGFLFAAGPAIVSTLYDHRYEPAGSLLQLLSFSLLFARYSLAHNAYLSLGKPSYLTTILVVKLISLLVLVPALYHLYGLSGAVVGVAFHVAPTLPLVYWFNHRHGLNDLRFEGMILGAWPMGYGAGLAFVALLKV